MWLDSQLTLYQTLTRIKNHSKIRIFISIYFGIQYEEGLNAVEVEKSHFYFKGMNLNLRWDNGYSYTDIFTREFRG